MTPARALDLVARLWTWAAWACPGGDPRALAGALESIDRELGRRGIRLARPAGGPVPVLAAAVLAAIADGPIAPVAVAARTGQGIPACRVMISKLLAAGQVRRVGRGLYALPEAS